jgi:hypothetical protein
MRGTAARPGVTNEGHRAFDRDGLAGHVLVGGFPANRRHLGEGKVMQITAVKCHRRGRCL